MARLSAIFAAVMEMKHENTKKFGVESKNGSFSKSEPQCPIWYNDWIVSGILIASSIFQKTKLKTLKIVAAQRIRASIFLSTHDWIG